MDEFVAVLFICFVAFIVFICGVGVGDTHGVSLCREDAIRHGAAHWEFASKVDNTPKFVWNTP